MLQWAFGVLIWELLTLAQQPYADVDPFEMATYLKEGFRIAQPINCPDELLVFEAAVSHSHDMNLTFNIHYCVCVRSVMTSLVRLLSNQSYSWCSFGT